MRRLLLAAVLTACTRPTPPPPSVAAADLSPEARSLCDEATLEPHVQKINDHVYVAMGYDLANTTLIATKAGNVIVDAAMSPEKGRVVREALAKVAPGKTLAVIYTHSHLDHVGGASAFVDEGTEIWASAPFQEHFLKQYGLFQPIEAVRGMRQYGFRVAPGVLPCTSIGPLPDMRAALSSGARLPTKTFSGRTTLHFGDTELELIEAHGETHDQLNVWLPQDRVLLSGDNVFRAFPNIYTIRGTANRPVNEWIGSLDRIRELVPDVLIPGHTEPIVGADKVTEVVTAYRDAIQWVRDATVRGANAGLSADSLAETIRLPEHLRTHPYLQQTYGQVDWSVRAIYGESLGWFSGEAERLYPVARRDALAREVGMMGGAPALLDAAEKALNANDVNWAVHLLSKVRDSGLATGKLTDRLLALLSRALDQQALATTNTNGRGYLAESAVELREGRQELGPVNPDDAFVRQLPLDVFLKRIVIRLNGNGATDVHEAIRLEFPDLKQSFTLTVRHGVAEVREGKPLPGTPEPIATLKIDSVAFKHLALKQTSIAAVVAKSQLSVDGSWVGLVRFLKRFAVE